MNNAMIVVHSTANVWLIIFHTQTRKCSKKKKKKSTVGRFLVYKCKTH